MTEIEKAQRILRSAEEGLLSLIADSAVKRNYPVVGSLNDIARTLGQLAVQLGESPRQCPAAVRETRTRTSKPAPVRRSEYPKYFRQDGALVKVGWSKKAKDEYTHRVSKEVFDAVADTVRLLGCTQQTQFDAQQIAERTGALLGGVVPMYQVYVTLAFLRANGIIHKVGREGYRATDPESVAARASGAWSQAAERHEVGR